MEHNQSTNEIGESLAAFGQEFGRVLDPVAGMPAFAVFLAAWQKVALARSSVA